MNTFDENFAEQLTSVFQGATAPSGANAWKQRVAATRQRTMWHWSALFLADPARRHSFRGVAAALVVTVAVGAGAFAFERRDAAPGGSDRAALAGAGVVNPPARYCPVSLQTYKKYSGFPQQPLPSARPAASASTGVKLPSPPAFSPVPLPKKNGNTAAGSPSPGVPMVPIEGNTPGPVIGEYVDPRTGHVTIDSRASFADQNQTPNPFFASYDAAVNTWLPVPYAQIAPDGKSYVIVEPANLDNSNGQNPPFTIDRITLDAHGQTASDVQIASGHGMSGILGYDGSTVDYGVGFDGPYLTPTDAITNTFSGEEANTATTFYAYDVSTKATATLLRTSATDTSNWQVVHSGSLWGVAGTTGSGWPSIVQSRDLSTGRVTQLFNLSTWARSHSLPHPVADYRALLIGFDGNGDPLLDVAYWGDPHASGQSSTTAPGYIIVVSAPNQATTLHTYQPQDGRSDVVITSGSTTWVQGDADIWTYQGNNYAKLTDIPNGGGGDGALAGPCA